MASTSRWDIDFNVIRSSGRVGLPGLVLLLPWLLSAAGCGISPPVAEAAAAAPPTVAQAAAGILRIDTRREGGHTTLGCGVRFGVDGMLTAAHVVREGTSCRIVDAGGDVWTAARVQWTAPELDLTLLQLTSPTTNPGRSVALSAAKDDLKPDAPIWILGRRGGPRASRVARTSPHAPLFALIDAEIGDSGGAVVDSAGRLVGIVLLSGDPGYALSLAWLTRTGLPPPGPIVLPTACPDQDSALLWGVMASRNRQWPAAARLLAQAHERAPTDPSIAFLLGKARLEAGDPAGAAQAFEAGVAQEPHNAHAWHDLGVACHRQGAFARAIECYQRALALDPWDPETSANLRAARRAARNAGDSDH